MSKKTAKALYTPKIISVDAYCPSCLKGVLITHIGIDLNLKPTDFPCKCTQEQINEATQQYFTQFLSSSLKK